MSFQALVADKKGEDVQLDFQTLNEEDLPEGDVLIRVLYSSVNYKDGLATIAKGQIVKDYPMVPGIDLAGVVEKSADDRYEAGEEVIVTSYELGVSHFGGYSEYARVPGEWVVPLPKGLDSKTAMIYGTAGLTAGLSVDDIEEGGVRPEDGEVLVTGATGGVGSMAVAMLAKRGYHVTASTGKKEEHSYLQDLGAETIVSREDVSPEKVRPLSRGRWAAVVDPVGGNTLAYALSTMKSNGVVAVSGLTGGTSVQTSVFPFILRGVRLQGVDSVYLNMERRKHIWKRLGSDLHIGEKLESVTVEYPFRELPEALNRILKAKMRGRAVVSIK